MKKTSKYKRLLLFIFILFVFIPIIHILGFATFGCLSDAVNNSEKIYSHIVNGNIAVVQYNSTDGLSVYTANSCWQQQNSENSEMSLKFNPVENTDEYLLVSDNNICMTGTYDNSALVFYVKETESDEYSISVSFKGMDEALFFADIESETPDIDTSVCIGTRTNSGYEWKNIFTHNTSAEEICYTFDYSDCYYDSDKNAYEVVLKVSDGMIAFGNLTLNGLELVNIEGNETDLFYLNGKLMQDNNSVADAYNHINFSSVEKQMLSDVVSDKTDAEETENNTLFSVFFAKIKAILQKIADFFSNLLPR